MKQRKIFFGVLLLLLGLNLLIAEVPPTEKLYSLLDEVFDSFNYDGDVALTISIIDEKPDKPKVAYQYKTFRRDSLNQTTLLQLAPEVDKGMGYLQDGDNIWTYDPNTRQFNHYSIKQNLSDSNFTMSDVNTQEKFSQNFQILSASQETLGKIPVYKVETKPIYKDAEYAKEIYYLSIKDNVVLKVENYGASGRLMRTILVAKYVNYGKTRVPVHQIAINNIVPGERTTMIMSDFDTKPLPDMVFTKAYLEKVN